MTISSASPTVTLVDGSALFGVTETLAERHGRPKITINYPALKSRLDERRRSQGWRPATLTSIMLSTDPAREGQQRFHAMLTHSGFDVDSCHYREAYASPPPGRTLGDAPAKNAQSFASRLSYVAGLMARYIDPQILFVTHSFELYGPLLDLASRVGDATPRGRVGLAFFGSLVDFRWRPTGLLDRRLQIEWFDLDPYGEELFGLDIGGAQPIVDARAGLGRF